MIFLAKMYSTFLFRQIYEEKGKSSRIYGNLIATREEKILHNNKQKTELTIKRDNIIVIAKSRRTFLHEYLDYENK